MNYFLMIVGILLLVVGIFQSYGKRWRERLIAHPTFSSETAPTVPIKFEYRTNDPNLTNCARNTPSMKLPGKAQRLNKSST